MGVVPAGWKNYHPSLSIPASGCFFVFFAGWLFFGVLSSALCGGICNVYSIMTSGRRYLESNRLNLPFILCARLRFTVQRHQGPCVEKPPGVDMGRIGAEIGREASGDYRT